MSSSLGVLLDDHNQLDEIFRLHQEALLMRNFPGAMVQLNRFARLLEPHMQAEEELLLPLYAQRAGVIPGGGIELFQAEHKKILKTLGELTQLADGLTGCKLPEGKRENDPACREVLQKILKVIDKEYLFKDLMHHHDLRERTFLYPALERMLAEEEKFDLVERMVGLEMEEAR